jgi:hypothetical protein
MWMKKNYMKLAEEEEGMNFLGVWKKLNSDSSSCEVWIWFGFWIVIIWAQMPSDFFFS